MKTTHSPDNLLDLVGKAQSGKLVLPQFQRNFVWSRDSITDLLVSILEGYFIGTFLLLRTNSNSIPFAMRPLQGIDNLKPEDLQPEFMILDGQQRLTSLNYAFTGPNISLRKTSYAYRFFLDLKKVVDGEFDDAIWSDRIDRVGAWYDREKQYEEMVIPFTEISASKWKDWVKSYENRLRNLNDNDEQFDYYWENHRDPWGDAIDQLTDFQVDSLIIEPIDPDNPNEVGQVCAIFEKMNSTGVALSVYDLLTARMYIYKDNGQNIDIHSLWKNSVEKHPLLNKFSGGEPDAYGLYLLRVIALLRGSDVKSKTIINLSHEDFVDDWHTAALYMEKALQRITSTNADGFGVIDPKWLPYTTMISPMAALLAKIDEHKAGHRAYQALRKWYWSSALLERYAGSVESTIQRDYQDLLKVITESSEEEPAVFALADSIIVKMPTYSIKDENRVNAVYKAILCMIALRGAKDFRTGDSIEFSLLDDHHIFPDNYLKKMLDSPDYTAGERNTIVNRTLISRPTNQTIKDKAPSDYLVQFVPDEQLGQIMHSHFITEDAVQAMRDNDFEAFLLAREKALIDEIRRQLTIN